MPAAPRFLLAFALAGAVSASAQGGSAVITLVMPPPGGEGYTALQSGTALAEGAASAYYNPAALAELYRSTGSAFAMTHSRQQLLPALNLKDLQHRFSAMAMSLPDSAGGTDIGIAMYRNHVEFGENTRTDNQGNPGPTFNSEETVWGLALGLRLGLPVSAGLAVKFIDSRLAQGITSSGLAEDGTARDWAFDLSLLAMPRFADPMDWGFPVVFTPSAGLMAQNLGPDVFYNEAYQSDPIPTTYTAAVALRGEAWDLLQATGHFQIDQEWTRRSTKLSPVFNSGVSVLALIFTMGWAKLYDDAGKRNENHYSWGLEFDMSRWQRAVSRMRTGDWRGSPGSLPVTYGFGRARFFGSAFALNPRVVMGNRIISSKDNGIRDEQKAFYFGFSL